MRVSFFKFYCQKHAKIIKNHQKTGCINELRTNYTRDDLGGWAPRQAAADIQYLSSHYKAEGKKVVVYAVSYGTFVLNKLLDFYPDSVDGAIADSVVPITADISRNDYDFEETANLFISTCQNSSFCRSKFTNITTLATDNIAEIFKAIFITQRGSIFSYLGQCMPTFYTSDSLRLFFTQVLRNADSRKIIFPLLFFFPFFLNFFNFF